MPKTFNEIKNTYYLLPSSVKAQNSDLTIARGTIDFPCYIAKKPMYYCIHFEFLFHSQ